MSFSRCAVPILYPGSYNGTVGRAGFAQHRPQWLVISQMPCLRSRAVRGELWGSHHLISKLHRPVFHGPVPPGPASGHGSECPSLWTQFCRGTHSTHWKQLQAMQSQIQLERSFPFISTGTTITAQKGHKIEGNRTRAQLLQEINSPVPSTAAARGHCELAAADGEKVFILGSPLSAEHTHVFDEGGENCICLAEASQQCVHTAPCWESSLHQLVIDCQKSSQLQNYTFLQSLSLV